MQIHELNTYDGTPDDSTYLALDDGSETSKVPATDIYPAMTQSQITSGVNTVKRVLTAAVLKPAIIAVAKTITDTWVDMTTPKINLDTSAASGDDYDLTQVLTSLGWLTDVVSSGVLGVKKLLHKTLGRLILQHGLMTIDATNTSVVYNHVFRYGGIGVVILGLNGISGATANNWKQVATLPTGFAPTYYSEISSFIGTGYGFASVRADGTVWIQPTVTASSYLIRLVIPIVYS